MNSSATGGYLLPTATQPLPGPLTLTQFIQSVLVGISGLPGNLCRPKWQINPPKQPDISSNWLAFKVSRINPDTYGYFAMTASNKQVSQRHEDLAVDCAFYGPNSHEYADVVTDGFQIPQNLEALSLANMGFTSTSQILLIPDLVNERWVEKYEMEILLRREIQRTYNVLSFLSASGTITSDTTPTRVINWEAGV